MTIAGKGAGRQRERDSEGPRAADVARPLLAWYARARRDLPWRRSADPYRVWVSEIMLQQTQVERVKEFFTRFIARFPDVRALAAAREPEVLRLWEGLGYYRRARQLHAAAKVIVAEHGGEFPQSAAELRALPGIGRYTAGAIASIAFGAREPIVEANSRRVIARLVGHDGPLGGTSGDEPIWEAAGRLVPARQPGRFNQALMDLGALVCATSRPLCGTCPLATACVARREGRVDEIPHKAPRRAVRQRHETAVVAARQGRVLVVRRGADEWWAGLWDFPRLPGRAARAARGLAACPRLGVLRCGPAERLGTVIHTVTHHRITLDVVRCAAGRAGVAAADRRWVTPRQLAALAMTSPARRIARLFQ
ncbi:MAG: A/G-specific adenine glycosylase [Planctomycetia bacterium]